LQMQWLHMRNFVLVISNDYIQCIVLLCLNLNDDRAIIEFGNVDR